MIQAQKRTVQKENLWVETYWQVNALLKSPQHSRLSASRLGHLILAPKNQPAHYQCDESKISIYGSHILFPQASPVYLRQSSKVFLCGAELSFGTLYLLSKKQGLKMPTDHYLAEATSFLLKEEPSFESSIQIFDHIFKELKLENEIDGHYILSKAADSLLRTYPHAKVSELGRELNISQRTLERSFKRVTGMSLKTYQNIHRFNSYLEEFLQSNTKNPTSVEELYYFYDQSHCIRQFQTHIGQSPLQLLKNDDLISSFYQFQEG
ncbi:HTH-type transcriptional regulator, AraC family protein [Bdellovibrio bacteriovorus W]|nr:HTH-type transcriptional regulator, AraC family protein [Bdellovibrio bacteriovorus W]